MISMIDWLSATVDLEDYNENLEKVLNQLEMLKIKAIDNRTLSLNDKVLFEIGQRTFEVKAAGTSTYAYLLHNNLMELRLAKVRSNNKRTYPIYVHFKSEFLWFNGPENCWYWFENWINEYFAPIITNKINRVDLCCHTDKFPKLSLDAFKGKYNDDDLIRNLRQNSTLTFGSRKSHGIIARIYDKSKEIEKSRKQWFRDIWIKNNMNFERIINIEFELNRNFLKDLVIDTDNIETVEDLFNNLKPIWKYCTSNWLVMIPKNTNRVERAPVKPIWKKVQKAFNSHSGEGMVSRNKQKQWKLENLLPSAFGYIISISACLGIKEIDSLQNYLSKTLKNLSKKKGKDFNELVTEKMKLMGINDNLGGN